MLSKNAVENDPFPTQLFIASVFQSAVLVLIDFWLTFWGGVMGMSKRDCQYFKK